MFPQNTRTTMNEYAGTGTGTRGHKSNHLGRDIEHPTIKISRVFVPFTENH